MRSRRVAPLMLFSILFGLSMDYYVFLLSRIKEEYYGKTGDNDEAVAYGLNDGRHHHHGRRVDHGGRVHGLRGSADDAAADGVRPRRLQCVDGRDDRAVGARPRRR